MLGARVPPQSLIKGAHSPGPLGWRRARVVSSSQAHCFQHPLLSHPPSSSWRTAFVLLVRSKVRIRASASVVLRALFDSLVNYLDAALRPIFGPWCFRFAPHVRGSLFGLCGSQPPRRCPGTSPSGMLVLVWFLSCDGKAGLCDEWSGRTRFAVAQVRA